MSFLVYLRKKKKELNPFTEEQDISVETPAQLDRVEKKFEQIEAMIKKALNDKLYKQTSQT
jgi:hypothetical protein